MKASIKVFRLRCMFAIFSLFVSCISACTPPVALAITPPVLASTLSIASAQVSPTLNLAITSPTTTPVATMTPPDKATSTLLVRAAEPDLLLGTGTEDYTLSTCLHKGAIGELWLSRYPYEIAFPLLADPREGFYNPTWSPDGRWIAFGGLSWDAEPTKIAQGDAGFTNRYENSLQVSIIRPDGSEKRAISKKFPRDEYVQVNNSCNVISYISSISWSFDNQWLAFIYKPDENGDNNTFVSSNIKTGEQQELLLPDVWDYAWAYTANEFAVTQDASRQIKIYSMENLDSPKTLEYPNDLPDDLQTRGIFWSQEDKTLYVVGSGTLSFSFIFWKVDLTTGEWIQLDINDPNMSFNWTTDSIGYSCSQNPDLIEFVDLKTGETIGKIDIPEEMSCEASNWFRDKQGRPGISFVSYDGRSILKILISDASILTEMLTVPQEMTPGGTKIISQDWSP